MEHAMRHQRSRPGFTVQNSRCAKGWKVAWTTRLPVTDVHIAILRCLPNGSLTVMHICP
jgi:hypothetical protein